MHWGIAAAFSIIFATLLGAFNAYILLDRQNSIRWTIFLPIYWLAWAASLITPGQIGDIATISTLLKKQKIDWHLSLGRSLLDKLISFIVMAALASIGLYLTSKNSLNIDISEKSILLMSISIGILILLLRSKFNMYFSPKIDGARGLIGRTLKEAKLTLYQYPTKVIVNIILTIAKISLIGLCYWCIFRGLGADEISLFMTITLSSASSLVAYIPISFNGIGTVEASGLLLFSEIGLTTSNILAGFLALRLLVMLLAFLPSACLLLFWRYKVTY
jgi:uncharacterized membrane protein YbhN (UPF0104 family)